MPPGSQSSPRRLRQQPITEFVRDAASGVNQGLQRLRGGDGDGAVGGDDLLSPILPSIAQKRPRDRRDNNDSMTPMTSLLEADNEASLQEETAAPRLTPPPSGQQIQPGANMDEVFDQNDAASSTSSVSEPPRQKKKSEIEELRQMEASTEALVAPNGEERPLTTIPVLVTGGPDRSRAGEVRNVSALLGAIPRIRGIRQTSNQNGVNSSTDYNWDASGDIERSPYPDQEFELDDMDEEMEDDAGPNDPGQDLFYDEESEELREAVRFTQELNRASEQRGENGELALQADTRSAEAEAGDQYPEFMLRMTRRMERVADEVSVFREEMQHLYDMALDTRADAREAGARAEAAAEAANEANARCAENERSVARAVQEMAQQSADQNNKNELLERKIDDLRTMLLERLQVVENGVQAAAANAVRGAAGDAGAPLPQLDEATMASLTSMIKKHEAEESKYWRSTILVSGVRNDGPHRDSYSQGRQQLRAVGLLTLAEDSQRMFITATGNVRCTFTDPGEAQYHLREAKRHLARNRTNGVRVEILVPPKDVHRKNALNRLGRELKSAGRCDNYEIICKNGRILLKTYARATGTEIHDLEAGDGEQEDNCAVCLDGLANGEVVKVNGCGHRFHRLCAVRNWLMNGLSCCLCRQMPSTLSWESVTCRRCVRAYPGEPFNPIDFRVSLCGHVHRNSCIRDFFNSRSLNIDTLTMEDLRDFSRNGFNSPCYECMEGHRPRWVNSIATLEFHPNARLRRVDGPRMQPRRTQDSDGQARSERPRADNTGSSANVAPRHNEDLNARNRSGRASVRGRDTEQDAGRDRSQSLRQRLEREAGYGPPGPAARLRLPPMNPRSNSRPRLPPRVLRAASRPRLPESRYAPRTRSNERMRPASPMRRSRSGARPGPNIQYPSDEEMEL